MKPTHFRFLNHTILMLLFVFYCQTVSAQSWLYIASIAAQDIGVGRNGAVWATTTSGGILRWNGSSWDVYRHNQSIHESILQNGVPFFMVITPNVQDPGRSSIQIISGEYTDLVQMIESKIPTTACKK